MEGEKLEFENMASTCVQEPSRSVDWNSVGFSPYPGTSTAQPAERKAFGWLSSSLI